MKKGKSECLSVEGRNPVLESLKAKLTIDRLFLDSGLRRDERITEILNLAHSQKVRCEKVNRRFLNRRSQTGVHQGVIALARLDQPPTVKTILAQAEKDKKDPFFIILPHVLYEHNLGAVIRTAEAVGVNAVLVPSRSPGLTPVVVRTSMGACFWVPLIQVNFFNTLKELADDGLKIVGAEIAGRQDYWSTDLTGPLALIVGGEDQGLSQPVRKYCHSSVRIPMAGKINSLNLSVAAAVILYERFRQTQA